MLLACGFAWGIPDAIRGDPQALKDYFDAIPTGDPRFFLERDELTAEEEDAIDRLEAAEMEKSWNSEPFPDGPATAEEWITNVTDAVTTIHTGTATVEVGGTAADAIQEARYQHEVQITQLQSDLTNLHSELAKAERDRSIAQANLNSTQADSAWWESVAEGLGLDARTSFLKGRINDAEERIRLLRGLIAATGEALQYKIAEAERYEQALASRAVKSDAATLCAEEDRRFAEAVDLSRDLATARRQLLAGDTEFRNQLGVLDQQIANATANGLDLVAGQLVNDRAEVLVTYDLWLHGQQVNLAAKADAAQSLFARNAVDGIGATSSNDLMADVVGRGLDLGATLERPDQERIDNAALSARTQAQGSRATAEIYDWRDFAHDYAAEFRITFGSWDGFSSRYGAYLGGVGRGSRDAVVDLLVLGREALDTGAEAGEVAFGSYTGIKTDVFGRENLDFISGLEYDSEAIYDATQGVGRWVERRIEMQAGSGNVEQALGDVGYVVATVLAPEEAAALALAKTAKVARLARAQRIANAATDATRTGNAAADAARANRLLDPLDDAGSAARVGDAARADDAVPPTGSRMPDADARPTPAATPPPARAPPMDTRSMALEIDPATNAVTLTRSDGSSLVLEKRLGGGSFSEVYAVPGRDDIVIKITKPAYGAEQLDRFGYEVLSGIDSDAVDVTEIFNQYRITSPGPHQGGVVSVVETAPTAFARTPEIGQALPGGRVDMTPGQAQAFDKATKAIADTGHVWIDNHPGNFAFRQLGDGDNWAVVFFDFGGVIPTKSVDAAHELRRMILAPTDPNLLMLQNNARFLQEIWLPKLADDADALIDWQAFQQATGTRYETLGKGFGLRDEAGNLLPHPDHIFPSLPWSGVKYPALRTAVDEAAGASAPALAPVAGATAPPASGLVDRSAPTMPTFTPGSVAGVDRAARTLPETLPPGACHAGDVVDPYRGLLAILRTPIDPDAVPFVLRRLWVAGCMPDDPGCPGDAQIVLLRDGAAGQLPGAANGITTETNPARAKQVLANDPYLASRGSWGQSGDDQWAARRAGFEASLFGSLPPDLRPVTVAVIDTGLAWSHRDFDPDRLWINRREIPGNAIDDDSNGYVDDIVGWNFIEQNNLPWDLDGHGTLVTSIIAASTGNREGIAGVSPNARIMVLRALDANGRSRASSLIEAVGYAVDHGARVINISIGGREVTKAEELALHTARARGALVVIAAGNEGLDLAEWGPAGAPGAIGVGATDVEDEHLPWSNYGSALKLSAPGVDVLGLRGIGTDLMANMDLPDYRPGANVVGTDGGYFRASGTSFAAPLASGAAAVLWALHPDAGVAGIERLLLQSAQEIGYPGVDQITGYGRLDAGKAMTADPDVFVEVQIESLAVVTEGGRTNVRVRGTAAADELAAAWIEIGAGESPGSWHKVGTTVEANIVGDTLTDIDASSFAGTPQWTLKLVAEHRNGTRRETHFLLNLK